MKEEEEGLKSTNISASYLQEEQEGEKAAAIVVVAKQRLLLQPNHDPRT